MADPLKLQALTQVAIQQATQVLLDGGSVAAWERSMEAVLARGHTAAYLAGLAERLNVPLDSALVSGARLSKVERNEIKVRVREQLAFFSGFVKAARGGGLSDAQIAARAALYAGATRATYYGSRWGDYVLPFVPGDGGSPCLGHCRCTAHVDDGQYHYRLGRAEEHCTVCPERAGGSPYTVRRRAA